jgi:hypothetical protein
MPDRWRHRAPAPLKHLYLAQGVGLPRWLSLGEREGAELAFGAVGKFWQTNIEWCALPEAEFAAFDEPGWGKIACNFTVQPYDDGRTLLTYECRTATTDPVSQPLPARPSSPGSTELQTGRSVRTMSASPKTGATGPCSGSTGTPLAAR